MFLLEDPLTGTMVPLPAPRVVLGFEHVIRDDLAALGEPPGESNLELLLGSLGEATHAQAGMVFAARSEVEGLIPAHFRSAQPQPVGHAGVDGVDDGVKHLHRIEKEGIIPVLKPT